MSDVVQSGSLKLSYKDVEYFQSSVIKTWRPKSEVWYFKYGGNIAAILSGMSATYIMYNTRRHLKLRNYAPLTCYMPVAGLACFLAEQVHDMHITNKILTGRQCPLCISTYSAAIQLGLGVAYPLVIAPLIGFYIADKLLTYPIPSISRAPRYLLKLWWEMTLKNPRSLFAVAVLEAAVMMHVTQEKQKFVMNYVKSQRSSQL